MISLKTSSFYSRRAALPAVLRIGGLALLACAYFGFESPSHAASVTWIGDTSVDLSGSNWNSGNGLTASNDSWTFGAAGVSGTTLTNSLTSGFTVAGITFNSGAPAYSFSGNALTLTGSITNNSTSLQTFNNNFATTAVRTIAMTGGGGDVTFAGNLSGSGFGLTTSGTGTLTLSGSNSYTGATTLSGSNAVTLKLASVNALGGSGTSATTIGIGASTIATLQYAAGATLNANAKVVFGGINPATLNVTLDGNNQTWSTLGMDQKAILNVAVSSGSATLTVSGTTTQGATGTASSQSQTISPGAGVTMLLSDVTAASKNNATYTLVLDGVSTGNAINGVISDNTSIANSLTAITKQNSSTWTLSNANTYTGATTVSSGTLVLKNQNAVQNSPLTVNTGGVALFDSSVASGTFNVGALAGTGTVSVQNSASTPIVLNIGANTTTSTLSGVLVGSGTINKSGAGAQVLSGSSGLFTGVINLNAGTIRLGNGSLGAPGAIFNVLGSGTISSSSASSGITLTNTNYNISADLAVGAPGFIGRITTPAGGVIDMGGTTRTVTLYQGSAITISGSAQFQIGSSTVFQNGGLRIVGGGATSPTAPGVFLLNTSLTFNSDLTIGPNATTCFNSGAIGMRGLTVEANGALNLSDGSANNRNLSVAWLSGTGSVVNAATTTGTATLTVNGTTSSSFDGVIQDGGYNGTTLGKVGLTKNGSSTLTLNGINTYTALTTVTAGKLVVNGRIAGSGTVASVGTLAGTGTFAGPLSVSGTIAAGNATGTLTASNNVTLNSGGTLALSIDNDGASSSLLNVGGNLDLGTGTDKLVLTLLNTLPTSNVTLVNYTGTLNGTFNTIVGLPTDFSISYGTGLNSSITLVVPEPTTILTLLGGAGVLAFRRRRRS